MPAPCGHQGLILFQESQARRAGRVNHSFRSFDDKKLQRQPSVLHALGWKAERKHVRVTRWVGSVLAVDSLFAHKQRALIPPVERHAEGWACGWPGFVQAPSHPRASSSRWQLTPGVAGLTEPCQPPSLVPGDSAPGGGRFFLADPALGKLDQKITIQAGPKPELQALDTPSSML